MNWKRIVRDLIVMVSLCGTFYISAIVVRQIDEILPTTDKSFSPERVTAELTHEQGDWTKSAASFQSLIDRDPYNGYANFQLASCYLWMRFNTRNEIVKLTESQADPLQLESLQTQFTEFENLALSALKTCSEFRRHRRSALYHLAAINSERGEFDLALMYLEEFVDEGYWLTFGLENAERFGSGGRVASTENPDSSDDPRLHQFPRFWELVDQENKTRSQNVFGPQIRIRPRPRD